jgi:FlaA1/EpsC-like NDP-sugar epimerase
MVIRMSTLSIGQTARSRDWTFGKVEARCVHMAKRAWCAYRSFLVICAEIVIAAVSYVLAIYVLSETHEPGWAAEILRATFGFLILFRLAGLVTAGLYRRSLRYASIPDLISICKIAIFSSLIFWAFAWSQFPGLRLPFALIVLDCLFLQLLWGSLHFGSRILKTQQAVRRTHGRRVLIVGAGDAGMTLLKELSTDPTSACKPIALVDDDPAKSNRSMYGVPVVSGTKDIAKLAAKMYAEEILICIPSATPSQMKDILTVCRASRLPVRTLPSLTELAHEKVSRCQLRSPKITDLLDRTEILIDLQETRRIVGGKVVLVTGAGGSIGSELCRQIAQASPQKIILLDKSENSLFYVHREVSQLCEASRVKPVLADILNRDRLRELLRSERPEIVFHAAAHKHVGLLELHPQEAIRNNVIGTRNIAEAAMECGAARFVNISTDKAVSPRSYMGLSKKLTELYIQELARTHRKPFSNVRFGNVAGSSGSVLRLFWEQIQKGEPILVTDPRATRYFMSVPEAVHLILRAAALGKGGETFVFDMGEPLNIYELAKTMTLFAGLEPGRDLPIEFIGLKDGEKIEEELWADWEQPVHTKAERILVIAQQNPSARGILCKIRKMETLLQCDDQKGLLEYLSEIEPGFKGTQTDQGGFQVSASTLPSAAFDSMGAA